MRERLNQCRFFLIFKLFLILTLFTKFNAFKKLRSEQRSDIHNIFLNREYFNIPFQTTKKGQKSLNYSHYDGGIKNVK